MKMCRVFWVSTQSNCQDTTHKEFQEVCWRAHPGDSPRPASPLGAPPPVSQDHPGRTLEGSWKIEFLRRAESSSLWKIPGCKNRLDDWIYSSNYLRMIINYFLCIFRDLNASYFAVMVKYDSVWIFCLDSREWLKTCFLFFTRIFSLIPHLVSQSLMGITLV